MATQRGCAPFSWAIALLLLTLSALSGATATSAPPATRGADINHGLCTVPSRGTLAPSPRNPLQSRPAEPWRLWRPPDAPNGRHLGSSDPVRSLDASTTCSRVASCSTSPTNVGTVHHAYHAANALSMRVGTAPPRSGYTGITDGLHLSTAQLYPSSASNTRFNAAPPHAGSTGATDAIHFSAAAPRLRVTLSRFSSSTLISRVGLTAFCHAPSSSAASPSAIVRDSTAVAFSRVSQW